MGVQVYKQFFRLPESFVPFRTIYDGADKLKGNYTITWNATEKYLEPDNGKQVFRLRYRTKAKC